MQIGNLQICFFSKIIIMLCWHMTDIVDWKYF